MQQQAVVGPLVASLSRRGIEHTVNQDTALAAVDTSGGRQVAYAAVFDGHGVMGEVAACVARETLGRLMVHAASKDEWFRAPDETIRHLISDLHDAVIRSHQPEEMALPYKHRVRHYELTYDLSEDGRSFLVRGGDGGEFYEPIDFGCTACIAVLLVDGTSQRVVCANLGDSPALLCRETRDGLYDATELSRRHAASEESEQLRLREFLGDSTAASVTSGTLRGMQGPLEGHALEPTRGLGHPVFSEFGFSQEPHVLSMNVDGADGVHALVVVTDGVSDALTNQEILQCVLSSAAAEDLPHSLGLGASTSSRIPSSHDGAVRYSRVSKATFATSLEPSSIVCTNCKSQAVSSSSSARGTRSDGATDFFAISFDDKSVASTGVVSSSAFRRQCTQISHTDSN
ncbi:hypothetical protein AB1Y20_023459 [Prymnesium parvum]|uniref:PPM-type phosphatase domain-containing protein n=1 Tax=Prymnesium parvum TaxID=97485 RepID=A0AB34JDC2_PRYPA